MNSPQINLHIEELVLDGFASIDGLAIADAVSMELLRLLGEKGLPASLTNTLNRSSLAAAPIQLQASSTPAHVGMKIGKAIYQGMRG